MIRLSHQLLLHLKQSECVVVFTGAGVSSESGVPTFRGEDGIWKKFKAEELANFDSFLKNPELVWEWYLHRKKIMSSIQPNAGHYAIAQLESYVKNVVVITQNIDNLHKRAGSTHVLELHGNIERNYCIQCKTFFSNEEIYSRIERARKFCTPRCNLCNALIRPDVVWFGENLSTQVWDLAITAVKKCTVFFSVGTSSIVYPAASLIELAKQFSAYLVEINIEQTPLTSIMDENFSLKSGEVFPELIHQLSQTQV
ncbi:MAG: NAD-dependent deacylase [Ignavibacteria bacterium]|nr:NAD-dependent deacylase [Ignavibacteria bacterium]